MGVDRSDFKEGKEYHDQTLRDNVSLLDEEVLRQLNEVIVEASHGVIKKNEGVEVLELYTKVDSYVVETNVHFPTDINLLWDSGRKVLDTIAHLLKSGLSLSGWHKHGYHRRKFRSKYRTCAEIHRKKGANYQERLKETAEAYLTRGRTLKVKARQSVMEGAEALSSGLLNVVQFALLQDLQYYLTMLEKHIDLLDRRILKGEKIPHSEKVFSIFEPHTEWISKGKMHKSVELGHNTAIATDQYHFILDFEIMFHSSDAAVGMDMGKRIIKKFGTDYRLMSMSFDRGFYSSLTKEVLSKDIDQVIMPKRGRKTLAEAEQEQEEDYQNLRRAHSAVESNINQLEHNGLDRCPDKGPKAFRRYIALGIVSYNLHRLGRLLIQAEQAEKDKERARKAA
jgi:IS5 family transposase